MRFALIGHPVAGSLSPRLIAAGYGGRHSYDLLDFERFDDAWQAFLDGYDGINVTAPFKQDAFRRVDVLSPRAQATGAVAQEDAPNPELISLLCNALYALGRLQKPHRQVGTDRIQVW